MGKQAFPKKARRRTMPTLRETKSLEELRSVWKHLVYEIQMLNETGKILSTFKADPASDRDRVVQNTLIESFALHARSLTAFLYAEKPKHDDVIADDFLDDDYAWQRNRPPMHDLLNTVHPRVGKEVAHLTYSRIGITDEQRRWPFVQIAVEINLALREFLALLPLGFSRPPTTALLAAAQVPPGLITEVGSKGLSGENKPGPGNATGSGSET